MTENFRPHRCPICDTPTDRLAPWLSISHDVKSGLPISTGSLVWCKHCDLGMMRRLPSDLEVAKSYDLGKYYTHGSSHFPFVHDELADRILTKFAYLRDHGRMIDAGALIAHNPDARQILDVGCGSGLLLASLAGKGRMLTGVDPDPQARAVAATHGIDALDGTAERLPDELDDKLFDLAILTHVLEHCRDPLLALGNIRDCLADNGVLYCEVPNCGAVYFQKYAQISEMLDVPRHIHFFTANALSRLCDKVGLTVLGWRHHGYTRHFGKSWRAWENQIHKMLTADGGRLATPRRTWVSDSRLWLQSAFAPPDRKYDCIGFFATARR